MLQAASIIWRIGYFYFFELHFDINGFPLLYLLRYYVFFFTRELGNPRFRTTKPERYPWILGVLIDMSRSTILIN